MPEGSVSSQNSLCYHSPVGIFNLTGNCLYLGGHPLVEKSNTTANLSIRDNDLVIKLGALGKQGVTIPLKAITKVSIEDRESISAARVIMTGIIGLFWKKHKEFLKITFHSEETNMDYDVILTDFVMPKASDWRARIVAAQYKAVKKHASNKSS